MGGGAEIMESWTLNVMDTRKYPVQPPQLQVRQDEGATGNAAYFCCPHQARSHIFREYLTLCHNSAGGEVISINSLFTLPNRNAQGRTPWGGKMHVTNINTHPQRKI